MKRALALLAFALTLSCQMKSSNTENELLKVERDFGGAIVSNDVEVIGKFLSGDWVIIDSDGNTIDRPRFLGLIKSGQLSHDSMSSDDVKVRNYGACAVVTALTKTKGKFAGQEFATQERATDVFVKRDGRWHCVFSQLTKKK